MSLGDGVPEVPLKDSVPTGLVGCSRDLGERKEVAVRLFGAWWCGSPDLVFEIRLRRGAINSLRCPHDRASRPQRAEGCGLDRQTLAVVRSRASDSEVPVRGKRLGDGGRSGAVRPTCRGVWCQRFFELARLSVARWPLVKCSCDFSVLRTGFLAG